MTSKMTSFQREDPEKQAHILKIFRYKTNPISRKQYNKGLQVYRAWNVQILKASKVKGS